MNSTCVNYVNTNVTGRIHLDVSGIKPYLITWYC